VSRPLARRGGATITIAFYATSIVSFASAKITNLGMLQLRKRFPATISRGLLKQEESIMHRIVLNVFGLAVALGTSGLMFAATLA
jgi:hypothetical protein